MALRTPLYAWHVARKARMEDFGGWDMPITYSSITEEHHATRRRGGLFDISHMGRITFTGCDAVAFLDHVLTNHVASLKLGQIRYSLVLNETGGILDDVLVYRFPDYHLLVVNASNREKLMNWFSRHIGQFQCTMIDRTATWAMVACQGPRAMEGCARILGQSFDGLRYYFGTQTRYGGRPAIVSRTGYTGEDGLECIVEPDQIVPLWERLLNEAGCDFAPVGLGARDTLRLEAAMPLYGHELDESTDPLQAGLGWAVKPGQKDFIGKNALPSRDPNRPVRVGLELQDKRIARQAFAVEQNGQRVGSVTSGTFAPTLQKSIAMAYVSPGVAAAGTSLDVSIRGAAVPAQVVNLPFYDRKKQ